MNKVVVLSIISLVFMGASVSGIKYEVALLRRTLKNTQKEIEKSNDNIKVLSAEWNCLNNPERLKKLANKYIPDMKPIKHSQIVLYKDIVEENLIIAPHKSSVDLVLDKALGG